LCLVVGTVDQIASVAHRRLKKDAPARMPGSRCGLIAGA
jgi:hypothetical protein